MKTTKQITPTIELSHEQRKQFRDRCDALPGCMASKIKPIMSLNDFHEFLLKQRDDEVYDTNRTVYRGVKSVEYKLIEGVPKVIW